MSEKPVWTLDVDPLNLPMPWHLPNNLGHYVADQRFGKEMTAPLPDPVPLSGDHYRLELHAIVQEALGWLTPAEVEEAVEFAIYEHLEDCVVKEPQP